MANTYKDKKTKYLSADELIERGYKHKRNSIRKIRLNNLLLEEAIEQLQLSVNYYNNN
jgi:hypothetical protein